MWAGAGILNPMLLCPLTAVEAKPTKPDQNHAKNDVRAVVRRRWPPKGAVPFAVEVIMASRKGCIEIAERFVE